MLTFKNGPSTLFFNISITPDISFYAKRVDRNRTGTLKSSFPGLLLGPQCWPIIR